MPENPRIRVLSGQKCLIIVVIGLNFKEKIMSVNANAQSYNMCKSVKVVKVVNTDNDANKLLEEGWVLLHAGVSHQDEMGYNAKPIFILANKLAQ